MEKIITVSGVSRPYDCIIGGGVIDCLGDSIAKLTNAKKVLIVTDDNVDLLYGEKVLGLIKVHGFEAFKFVFPHGEEHKTLLTVSEILEFAAENKLSRSDCIVALGGGIVGDTAGFSASAYLRGIGFIQVPTTFLSAIDSSVGGKTGVNLGHGKNLAGAFYQPLEVICDTNFSDTLSPEIFSDGTAEAIKYGMIFDSGLFDKLKTDFRSDITEIISRCISLKAEIVKADEFDTGKRQLLNFGHTIGHAIEKCSDYKISHGRSVAIGMVMACRGAYKMGLCKEDFTPYVAKALEKNNLPVMANFSADELLLAMLNDKKRSSDGITLVIPEKIGKCVLHKISIENLEEFIKLAL